LSICDSANTTVAIRNSITTTVTMPRWACWGRPRLAPETVARIVRAAG
jgi:hypothetical protein